MSVDKAKTELLRFADWFMEPVVNDVTEHGEWNDD